MRKKILLTIIVLIVATSTFALSACGSSDKWKTKYDISLPDFVGAGGSEASANADGWYNTMDESFDGDTLPKDWRPVNNCLRNVEYWCDKSVSVGGGNVAVAATKEDNHQCENCKESSGLYTSGIITATYEDGKRVPTFAQAFGYFEATVKFPNSDGMWSAFWLQTNSQGQVGNGGKDGAEIDIYESSFWNNKDAVGQCIHYDGYGKKHRSKGATHDVGYDLYDGYHKFALKWTPDEYVFYVDDIAVWATDFGGICTVPAYLMLTNEIRKEGTYGPYAQKLGKFTGGTFLIDDVKVYQNTNYLPHIKSADEYK